MSVWLPMVLIVLSAIAFLVWRGMQMGQLVRDGVQTEATIVKKARLAAGANGIANGQISYEFVAGDGRRYRRSSTVSDTRWAELTNGQSITVVYLPNRPATNAPAWQVDQAREALKK